MLNLETVTVDQLRLFITVAEEGSFTGASRKLRRAQSAVSYGIANLEEALEVKLFERSGRRTRPTAIGSELLTDARRVMGAMNQLGARASSVAQGLELELSIALSVLFPVEALILVGRSFRERFPTVDLNVRSDVMDAVPQRVLSGECHFGVGSVFGAGDERLVQKFLFELPVVAVASASHPLAAHEGAISRATVAEELQIVISQKGEREEHHESATNNPSIFSKRTWRVFDAHSKLALIEGGIGWGFLPHPMVHRGLASGSLVHLSLQEVEGSGMRIPFSAFYSPSAPPGPAGMWLLAELERVSRLSPTCPIELDSAAAAQLELEP